MTTLTDFLLARIADDEAAQWDHAAIDRPRWMAECEAKRQVMAEHADYGGYGESCHTCQDGMTDMKPWPCPTLRYLAAVYADHPDYRDEWKP